MYTIKGMSFPQSRMLSGGRESFFKKQERFSMRVFAESRSDRTLQKDGGQTSRNYIICVRVISTEL